MAWDQSEPGIYGDAADLAARLHRLYETEVGRTPEFVLRNTIVLTVGLGVGLVTGTWVAFVWLAVYLSIIAVYALFLSSRRRRDTATRRDWTVAVALAAAACTVYTLLPLYLWLLPSPAMNFVAASGVFGMAMLNLTRHTFDGALALLDMAVVCAAILIMGAVAAHGMGATPQAALVMAGTLACATYYAFAHRDALVLRTRLLDNERRAAQAAKMQAMGQLTTGIAHDFNNILTVVIGNIELARLSEDRAEIDESLCEAHRAAERASTLVAQLLAFSRRAQLRPVAIEPDTWLAQFVRTMERLLPAGIALRHTVAARMPPLRCDRTLLDTAMMNLVINARDAMQGRGSLAIRVEPCRLHTARILGNHPVAPGRYARIAVIDSGPGIPPDLLHRVAEPFFTTKVLGQGSGLGLAMVKGFSEQSGGGLEIASVPGCTEIALYLPLAHSAAPRETVTGQSRAGAPV